jgi:hypothetical protein
MFSVFGVRKRRVGPNPPVFVFLSARFPFCVSGDVKAAYEAATEFDRLKHVGDILPQALIKIIRLQCSQTRTR